MTIKFPAIKAAMERIQSLASAEAVSLDGDVIAFNFNDRKAHARVKITSSGWHGNQVSNFNVGCFYRGTLYGSLDILWVKPNTFAFFVGSIRDDLEVAPIWCSIK